MLYFSGIKVVICSGDPGIFDITLASEVEWVRTHAILDVGQHHDAQEPDHRLQPRLHVADPLEKWRERTLYQSRKEVPHGPVYGECADKL